MMSLLIRFVILLAFTSDFIQYLNVSCDNRLNKYSILNDTCYVKSLERTLNENEKLEFNLWYTTPEKIRAVDLYIPNNQPATIDHIPTEVFDCFPNLRALRVNTKVKEILPTDLQKGVNLTSLVVSNQLEKISKGIFPSVNQLESLEFYENRIKEIEDYAFDGLNKLFSLDLQNNELTEIRRNTFSGLPELHALTLYENQITAIEEYSFQLPKLEYLELNDNKLTTLPDNVFVGLVNIIEITLKNNRLKTINQSFYKLHNIQRIDLRRNEITDINHEEFSKLLKLIDLKL